MEAAEALLRTKGFNALSVEDVTKAAGVAKGTFYIYFKHKKDVVSEICKGYFEQIENQFSESSDVDFIERLSVYFDRFMEAVEIYGINICREWIREVIDPNNPPDNQDNNKWRYDVDMLRNILNGAVKNGELKKETPVELLAHLLISELYGMMTCWCMSDGEFEPTNWTRPFSRFQFRSILSEYLIKGENND